MTNRNDLIVKQNLNESGLTPLEIFYLMRIIDALPVQWRALLTRSGQKNAGKKFILKDHVQLRLDDQDVLLSKVISKNIYMEIRLKRDLRNNSLVLILNGTKFTNYRLR